MNKLIAMRHNYLGIVSLLALLLLSSCYPRIASTPDKHQSSTLFFNEGGGTFSLSEPEGLVRVGADQVMWANSLPSTSQNWVIAYFFPADEFSHRLGSPHIRMEYVSKSIEGASTEDELFDWMKTVFINDERKGILVSDQEVVKTGDGQEVRLLAINIPAFERGEGEEKVMLSGKQMMWAYISHEDYFIALNMTTVEMTDYEKMRAAFVALVGSFRRGSGG